MKKILIMILSMVLILSVFTGCQKTELGELTSITAFSSHEEFQNYKSDIDQRMEVAPKSISSASAIMLSQQNWYYVPSNSDQLVLDVIEIHEAYITTVFDIEPESTEGLTSTELSMVSNITCIWRQYSPDQIQGFFDNSVRNGQLMSHPTLENVNYIGYGAEENGEVLRMHYEIIYDEKIFSIFVPLFYVEDMTDEELLEFLKPKKVLFA